MSVNLMGPWARVLPAGRDGFFAGRVFHRAPPLPQITFVVVHSGGEYWTVDHDTAVAVWDRYAETAGDRLLPAPELYRWGGTRWHRVHVPRD